MNCQAGDLARIVDAHHLPSLDRYVMVIEDSFHRSVTKRYFGQVLWRCEAANGGTLSDSRGTQFKVIVIPDGALRPIRHPGDDATDETLLRLPAPTLETV